MAQRNLRASAGTRENVLSFARQRKPVSGMTALNLVYQAAEVFDGIEDHARKTEARAQSLCRSAIEKVNSAEVRIEAVERARKGDGPSLIECKTYRHRGHYEGDPQMYKSPEDIALWKARDPILLLRAAIVDGRVAKASELDAIEAEVKQQVEAAVEFAKKSPYPDPSEVTTDVYSTDNERSVAR